MNSAESIIIHPYCTVAWADAFFSRYAFSTAWEDASDEKKLSSLVCATDFIDLFCEFHGDDGGAISYKHSDEFTSDDDFMNIDNPLRLKEACAKEAVYLLSLDDNPAEPNPVTVTGLSRGEFGTVSKENVPPVFTFQVARLLQSIGGTVSPDSLGGSQISVFEREGTL